MLCTLLYSFVQYYEFCCALLFEGNGETYVKDKTYMKMERNCE